MEEGQDSYNIFRKWIRETIVDDTPLDADSITFSSDPEYVMTPGHCECGYVFVDTKKNYVHKMSCPSCDLYFDRKFLL
jgi:predicted Zn-ribbon and HTH transcriptional regulator